MPCPAPCDPLPCDPCVPCEPCAPCRPVVCNPCLKCGKQRRYIQPPRRTLCRPLVGITFPKEKIDAATIYKDSFQCIDQNTVKNCRPAPIRPLGSLRTHPASLSKDTVTKLSFPVYCNVERRLPIKPNAPSLLGEGPMQTLTTQRHDFVPKVTVMLQPVRPIEHFPKATAPIEKQTTQKLSFMAPCGFDRAVSCKPVTVYEPPKIPMEKDTMHRLSFMPVCPVPKDPMPWAEKGRYLKPTVQMEKCTTQRLSYLPPGCYMEDSCCCCDIGCIDSVQMAPRAAVC